MKRARVDRYLTGKARARWPLALVVELDDGRWWLTFVDSDDVRLFDPRHRPKGRGRYQFHAARRRLYELIRAERARD